METATFTAEECALLRQLVQSPGWALLMEHLFLPRVQQITQLLDRPGLEHADYMRGEKRAYLMQLETLYSATGLPNPLEVYALGLLRAVTRRHEDAVSPPKIHIMEHNTRLCGAQDGSAMPIVDLTSPPGTRIGEKGFPTCDACYTIFQDMRVRRGRGTATLV